MGLLDIVKSMKVGGVRKLGCILPGVNVKEELEVELLWVEKKNYKIHLNYMGILVKKMVFFDHKGKLVEVKQK